MFLFILGQLLGKYYICFKGEINFKKGSLQKIFCLVFLNSDRKLDLLRQLDVVSNFWTAQS